MQAATHLIITLIQTDVGTAEQIVNKGIVNILTPFIIEIDSNSNDMEKIILIRNTSQIYSELTDLKKRDILVSIYILFIILYRKLSHLIQAL
jgi:hypothetical protein